MPRNDRHTPEPSLFRPGVVLEDARVSELYIRIAGFLHELERVLRAGEAPTVVFMQRLRRNIGMLPIGREQLSFNEELRSILERGNGSDFERSINIDLNILDGMQVSGETPPVMFVQSVRSSIERLPNAGIRVRYLERLRAAHELASIQESVHEGGRESERGCDILDRPGR